MARSTDELIEAFRPYGEGVAKQIADELWGPHGPPWGTTRTALEDVALAARALVPEKLLELGLDRQGVAREQRPPQARRCPDCHRPFTDPEEPQPRARRTRAGEVCWHEPQASCTRCRRAFFP